MNSLAKVSSFVFQSVQISGCGLQQIRTKYADWKMIRDVKRRKCVEKFAKERLQINSIRKNDILPHELRQLADVDIAAFPRDSSLVRVRERCALTSRPRGVVHKYRLSRIVWRHLADYNKLSGVQRAMW
ncbi:28S ribosomal protein S14, mitochondrial [Scaptodrosophila lebanonensis]|uniref:28S ribosomal protein S14, mitochondrial n=1 Tax=Drosophila lebanonensis TaxID=7225 RepID=A0A6J2TZ54_DROLE|nr:28S ribosomal protein S14, mitochondrial [Scaptodrosophila lebanonensis]